MVHALESLVFTFILRAPLQSAHCSFQHIEGGTVAQIFKETNSGVQVRTAVKLMNLNLLSVNGPAVECLGIFPLYA
jgi:hypothetical protein